MDEKKNNAAIVGIAAFVAVCLAVLYLLGCSEDSDKYYSEVNMYAGEISERDVNPRVQYAQQANQGVLADVKCETVMSKAQSPRTVNGYYWMCDGETIDISDLESYAAGSDGSVLQGVFGYGADIVSVGQFTFLNSNVTSVDSAGIITITVQLGQEYVIEFYDVDSWWCHIGKSGKTSHTDIVGANGINEVCVEGYIIGAARDTTEARLYHLTDESMEPYPWKDFYFPSGS